MQATHLPPIITAFKNSPDRGRGLARDFRVRWALEEVNQPYDVELVTFDEMKKAPYRSLQPFGQIPSYREGDFVLFESGAIVLHIAEMHSGLLPAEPHARARGIMWIFSALNTVEPPIVERSACFLFERDKTWYNDRVQVLDERVHARLKELSMRLGDAQWLDGEFSAGDLMMVTVLRRLESSGLLDGYRNICDYITRATERSAYKRAFAAQLEVFKAAERANR